MNLELLGLNRYEAACYESLVRFGKASAPAISRDSGVPYGRIYDTLDSLVNKGLAVVVPEKTKKFSPADPAELGKLLTRKEKELQKLRQSISQLKKIYKEAKEEPVEIVKGKRNFYKIIRKLPVSKKSSYMFKFTGEFVPRFVNHTEVHLRSGVDVRHFVKYDSETRKTFEKWKAKFPDLKMKKFEFDKVAGRIVDEELVWFALVESNVNIIIRDSNFARLMKKLFELAWEKKTKNAGA